jgi:hypothetical protein
VPLAGSIRGMFKLGILNADLPYSYEYVDADGFANVAKA